MRKLATWIEHQSYKLADLNKKINQGINSITHNSMLPNIKRITNKHFSIYQWLLLLISMNKKTLIARKNLTNNMFKKSIKEPGENQFQKESNIFDTHTKHNHRTMLSILCSICCWQVLTTTTFRSTQFSQESLCHLTY